MLVNRPATPELVEVAAKANSRVLVATVKAEHKAGKASRYVVDGTIQGEHAREAFYPLFVPVLRDGAYCEAARSAPRAEKR